MWMKKANNFQIAKVQPRCCLAFAQFFCQFQPGVAYKSSAYINFSSYLHYYLQHFSKHYVSLSLKVLIKIINVNVVMKLKGVSLVLEAKMARRYQIGNFPAVS